MRRITNAVRRLRDTLAPRRRRVPMQTEVVPFQPSPRSSRSRDYFPVAYKGTKVTWEKVARYAYEIGRIAYMSRRYIYHYAPSVPPFGIIDSSSLTSEFSVQITSAASSFVDAYYAMGAGGHSFEYRGENPLVLESAPDADNHPNQPPAPSDTFPITFTSSEVHSITWEQAAKLSYDYGRAVSNRGQIVETQFGPISNSNIPSEFVRFFIDVVAYNANFHVMYMRVGFQGSEFAYRGLGTSWRKPRSATPASPSKSASNKVKSYKSKSIQPEEMLAQSCINKFEGAAKSVYAPSVNKIIRMCHDTIMKCSTQRVKEIQEMLRDNQYKKRESYSITVPDPEQSFIHVFNENKSDIFKMAPYQITVKFMRFARAQNGVGTGVTRTFIQNCVDAVANNYASDDPYQQVKFFVRIPETNRYVINPKMNVQHARYLGYNVQNDADLANLYTQIGRLFAFCLRDDMPLPFNLARAIYANILYKATDITPEMYAFYYIMDSDQELSNNIIKMLRDPDTIEYLGLYIGDDEVTPSNVIKYVHHTSKQKYLHNLYDGAADTYPLLKAFIKGFYVRNDLRINEVSVPELERMMCGSSVNIKNIRAWLKMRNNINYIGSTPQQQQILDWFKEILHDMGKTIPLESVETVMKRSSPNSQLKRQDAFVLFFMQLMFFWTSYKRINMDMVHRVTFERTDTSLPTSHTCMYALCLPTLKINSKMDLYNALITAVFAVDSGVDNV